MNIYTKEVWKDVDGYKGHYMVSNMGNVKSIKIDYNHIILVHNMVGKGYCSVGFCKIGVKFKKFYVHRLVANAFIDNQGSKFEVNHINGIKTDNRVENLEWCTRLDNVRHSWNNGLCEPIRKAILVSSKIKRPKKIEERPVLNKTTGVYYNGLYEAWVYSNLSYSYSYFRDMLSNRLGCSNKTNFIKSY